MKEGIKIILMCIGVVLAFVLAMIFFKAIAESSIPLWVKFWLLR